MLLRTSILVLNLVGLAILWSQLKLCLTKPHGRIELTDLGFASGWGAAYDAGWGCSDRSLVVSFGTESVAGNAIGRFDPV